MTEPNLSDGQQTGTHGARLDEELEHETRGLVQGGRSTEGMTQAAADHDASDAVVDRLRSLPAGQTFENVQDVARALGLHVESHRF